MSQWQIIIVDNYFAVLKNSDSHISSVGKGCCMDTQVPTQCCDFGLFILFKSVEFHTCSLISAFRGFSIYFNLNFLGFCGLTHQITAYTY